MDSLCVIPIQNLPMILYMLNTACGIGEAAGLSWSKNINLDERTITIDHQLIYKNLDGSTRFQQQGMVRRYPLLM